MTSCGDSSPKRNPVVVAPVGERCNSRKVAYQAWLQNKAESSLHSLYAELMCKSPQYSRWKSPKFNIGTIADINWILVTGKWTKYIVKTIRCKRGKKSHADKSIEDQNGVLLSNEGDIPAFQVSLNRVTLHQLCPTRARGPHAAKFRFLL